MLTRTQMHSPCLAEFKRRAQAEYAAGAQARANHEALVVRVLATMPQGNLPPHLRTPTHIPE